RRACRGEPSDRSVFCLGWNVTVSPPCYAHGCQETDVRFEAFPPPVHRRAEGRAAATPSRGQGAGLEDLRRERPPAVGVLPVAAPGPGNLGAALGPPVSDEPSKREKELAA